MQRFVSPFGYSFEVEKFAVEHTPNNFINVRQNSKGDIIVESDGMLKYKIEHFEPVIYVGIELIGHCDASTLRNDYNGIPLKTVIVFGETNVEKLTQKKIIESEIVNHLLKYLNLSDKIDKSKYCLNSISFKYTSVTQGTNYDNDRYLVEIIGNSRSAVVFSRVPTDFDIYDVPNIRLDFYLDIPKRQSKKREREFEIIDDRNPKRFELNVE